MKASGGNFNLATGNHSVDLVRMASYHRARHKAGVDRSTFSFHRQARSLAARQPLTAGRDKIPALPADVSENQLPMQPPYRFCRYRRAQPKHHLIIAEQFKITCFARRCAEIFSSRWSQTALSIASSRVHAIFSLPQYIIYQRSAHLIAIILSA